MDIAAWLRGQGLERYEVAFRENEIDWAVLPELTADDLKDIGVTAVGHRRKLLAAIAALRAPGAVGGADAVDSGDAGTGGGPVDMHRAGAAERHATAELRAGHAKDVTKHPQQRRIAVNLSDAITAIDVDFEAHHSSPGPGDTVHRPQKVSTQGRSSTSIDQA